MPAWSDTAGQDESYHAEPPKNRFDDDGLPKARPIAFSDSPRFQRSHNSVFSVAVDPLKSLTHQSTLHLSFKIMCCVDRLSRHLDSNHICASAGHVAKAPCMDSCSAANDTAIRLPFGAAGCDQAEPSKAQARQVHLV